MSNGLVYALIAVGLVIIALLAALIYRQIRTEQARKAEAAARERALAEEVQRQRTYLIDSVRIIAHAILHDEKITLTEGCIRLKVMIDNLDPTLHQHPDFDVIDEVYNRTQHIPYLADWKELDRKQQRAFEKEMRAVERECEARINKAAEALLKHPIAQGH